MYRRFMHLLRGTGSFRLHPVKTRIGVTSRMTFAEIVLRSEGLDGHLLLPRRVESPRFTKIVSGSPRVHVHSFRIRSLAELDEEFEAWLREAASVGRQEHLDTPISSSPRPASPLPAAEGRGRGAAPRRRRRGRP